MTSYEKLKQRNQELARRLMLVCLAPESDESQVIIALIKGHHNLEAAIWAGAGAKKFDGLIPSVIK